METKRSYINWMDLLWLVFLTGLALVPPVKEIHKQGILLAFGILQISEGWLIGASAASRSGLRGSSQDRAGDPPGRSHRRDQHQQQLLAHLLSAGHDGCGIFQTAGHDAVDRTRLRSFTVRIFIRRCRNTTLPKRTTRLLAIRILFFFLAAVVVNRFVVENRRQTQRYQELAETLAQTNRRLEQAQAEARRSERLAALRATLRRTCPRDSQSAWRHQGIGRDAQSEAGGFQCTGRRAGRVHPERIESPEFAGDTISGFCTAASCGPCGS